jgi:hypothetical protein
MLLPKHLASNIATISPRRVEITGEIEVADRELKQLRCENMRLSEELDRARMQPMLDNACNRVNVDHDLWLKQQKDLRRLHDYKTRYYVSAFILLLIVVRYCLHFVAHI